MPIFIPCDDELPCRRVFPAMLLWFSGIVVLALAMLHVAVGYDRENERQRVWFMAAQRTQLRREIASHTFEGIFPDLRFLASQNELLSLMASDTQENRDLLCRELKHFVQQKGVYSQARYLDETGFEVCRVDLRGQEAVIIPRAELQSKANAPYFREAIQLDEGQCFVSMLDLNVEHGQVEEPYNPVVRFCTPVFDRRGARRGIVALNYMGRQLLNAVREVSPLDGAEILLLDAQGYYLIGRRREDEWGFMFPERRTRRMQHDFPKVWEEMLEGKRGQCETDGYLFTFAKTHPLPDGAISTTSYRLDPPDRKVQRLPADEYRFIVVSLIPAHRLLAEASWLVRNARVLRAAILILALLAARGIAGARVRRDIARETIARLATYDTLTGLPNRNLFMERLSECREMGIRYGRSFALLFMDLNGFKSINDALGHEGGDELLRQVADRLRGAVRSSDTVARFGGDEFVVLVQETKQSEDAATVGQKLIDALAPPFDLDGAEGRIGTSIGVAMFDPASKEPADELIRRADDAMYEAKASGESTYRFSTPEPPAGQRTELYF